MSNLSELLAVQFKGFGPPWEPATPPRLITLPPEAFQAVTGRRTGTGSLAVNPHHSLSRITETRNLVRGSKVIVGIVDTGVDHTHPDLAEAIIARRDFTGSPYGTGDVVGHGTHCAGIVASRGNAQAYEGVHPRARIVFGKGLGDEGSGRTDQLAAAMRWCVDSGAHVLSLSWGGPGDSQDTLDAVAYARSKGVAVVAAAGNDGPTRNTVSTPGAYPDVMCVAAVNDAGQLADFSTRGDQVDAAACGVNILSTYPGGRQARMSGTSMATPQLAGVYAWTLEYLWDLGMSTANGLTVDSIIRAHLTDIAPAGRDPGTGGGYVNAPALFEAIRAALPPVTPPTPPPAIPPFVREINVRWGWDGKADVVTLIPKT